MKWEEIKEKIKKAPKTVESYKKLNQEMNEYLQTLSEKEYEELLNKKDGFGVIESVGMMLLALEDIEEKEKHS